MKTNVYTAPEVEILVMSAEDVVLLSGMTVKPNGTFNETPWTSIT